MRSSAVGFALRKWGEGWTVKFALILITALYTGNALAQVKPVSPYYARVNTFGVLASYSNDSSHILLGIAENRKLLNFGASYSRRLLLNRIVNWQYNGEILPVALESDPVDHIVLNLTYPIPATFMATTIPVGACHSGSSSGYIIVDGVTYTESFTNTCSRRWTIGEGMSPVGLQWNFLPRRKIQPLIDGHGGYMYSTQPIPTVGAGSFNFTFDFGVGLEMYRSKTRSIRAEYRYHHISNHQTANENPGIDNGLLQVTYNFGR